MALKLEDAGDLTAGEVVHKQFGAHPADATVADIRAWFEASTHRRMAFLAADGVYRGSITRADLERPDADPGAPATTIAADGPAVAADASAQAGYDIAVLTEARRAPVVDGAGILVGVLAVTEDLTSFCGVEPRVPAVEV